MKTYLKSLPLLLLISLISLSCKENRQYRIGVSQCSADDWRNMMNEEMEREMMFHPEATIEIRSAADDSERQIADIEYFINNGFDIIVVAPNEADALTPVISKAYEKGIPVLIFDRNIHGDSYTAFQGADNAAIGRMAARHASARFPEGARILELQGLMSSTPAIERGRGFAEVADSVGNLQIVASASANWQYEAAMKVADSLLTLYPDVDIIFAHNDRMAIGAADVAAKKGLDPYIIGIDAAPAIGMQAVKEGKIDATFLYPTEGDLLIKTALSILDGGDYEKNKLMPASPVIDKNNVDLLLHQVEEMENETTYLRELKKEVDQYWETHNSQTALFYTSLTILLLVCIVLFLVLKSYWTHRRHQTQLAEATQSKLRFFTNVSHDLRTPLTLIAEPVEQISKAPNLTEQQRTLMNIADKNVKILKRLINQILDFRKFENDKLDLVLEETEPGRLGREWAEAFRTLAAKKHINYAVNIDLQDGFRMAMDIEKIERVIFNILSNAFKFTPVKGSVDFTMSLWEENLKITVADTGRGISRENIKNIFTQFYQVDKERPEGSGIGLSLAKAFVELHDGTIIAESEENKGTLFTVTIPVRHVTREVADEAIIKSAQEAREVVQLLADLEGVDNITPKEAEDKPIVLVIDDNDDLRLMLKELLSDNYNIIGARDGREGINLAIRYVPDVIICDVMMPGMDGMETCAAIKNEISTSHIPVLMLTACTLDEQRVEGYESGADGYMAKPFSEEVLRARISSLLANRKRIKAVYGSTPVIIGHDERKIEQRKDSENEFYSRLLKIIDEEMGNAELSVDNLADRMSIGRSQFYRKIKALTGLSPIELLRDLRLKRARDLLLTTDKTVSEIAYDVGFSTPAYFTKCYREVYSETPTALRERMRPT